MNVVIVLSIDKIVKLLINANSYYRLMPSVILGRGTTLSNDQKKTTTEKREDSNVGNLIPIYLHLDR